MRFLLGLLARTRLYRVSTSLFWITATLALSHFLYVLDAAMGLSTYYPSRVFRLLFDTLPIEVWTTLHLVSALCLLLGLFVWDNLIKVGYLISVSTYWMITLAFTISFIEKPTSLYALSPTLLCAAVATLGFIEYSRLHRMWH